MGVLYLDASAAAKLIVDEQESVALAAFIREHLARQPGSRSPVSSPLVSSDLLRTELLAVTGRVGGNPDDARTLLRSVQLLALTPAVCDAAGRIAGAVVGPALGSLDAIHLASALTVVTHIDWIVTYDKRFRDTARSMGLEVVAPE
ncbi:VapC-like toxin [Pontimonas salivibrio]|uniref:VapC-like toxin n=1 Tax=Pontimonas salivibrio TaxID=1159327 RepID=A0A2L2BRX7_9MICO|nr:type II toxin-antitoxin system VapC family toxin [Pontimonas salivibrio]AVG24434.1 VapC-like toxin [Pontimonas salivibrio]